MVQTAIWFNFFRTPLHDKYLLWPGSNDRIVYHLATVQKQDRRQSFITATADKTSFFLRFCSWGNALLVTLLGQQLHMAECSAESSRILRQKLKYSLCN